MTDSQSALDTPPRKRELLAAARRRFVADGFKGTPVSRIVKEAGVAQGTFYLYFKNKAELIDELRREVVRTYEAALHAIAAREEPVDERLARIIVAMSVAVGRHVDLERVFRESGSGSESLVAAREGRQRMARHAAALLEADDGLIAGDAMLMARFVVTLFDEILFDAHAYAPDTIDAVVEESLRFTLRGLGVDAPRTEELVSSREQFRHDAESLPW